MGRRAVSGAKASSNIACAAGSGCATLVARQDCSVQGWCDRWSQIEQTPSLYDSGAVAHDLRTDCMMHPDCVTDQARYVFAEKFLLLRSLSCLAYKPIVSWLAVQ